MKLSSVIDMRPHSNQSVSPCPNNIIAEEVDIKMKQKGIDKSRMRFIECPVKNKNNSNTPMVMFII
jgi:hypothetical protein